MKTSTEIANATAHKVRLQVGGADVATIAAGGKHSVAVDFNATYREYVIGVDDAKVEKVIVSSDDLCDYKCITIKEANGKLNLVKEPRTGTGESAPSGQTEKKSKWVPAWLSRS